ncbi:ABC-type multidrug transport system, permease component [mine drainage metagenome]|uniref:ABC-type multidrug transport system, permease component n=1 Tax=mine drainage metagenome TaxID=410659 RepID=T1DGN3_9ZZZZ
MSTVVERLTRRPLALGRARWIGFETILIREFQRIVRIWPQTIVPSAVTATLYLVIFGSVIGRRIGTMDGFAYMVYIAPGLIMQAVIINSYNNVVSSFYGAKFGRHIEELLVSPLPSWIIVSGYVAGGIMRGAMVGLVVSGVWMFFTRLPVLHPTIIVAAAVLTSVTFSLGGFLNAMFAKSFDQISIIPTFVLTPLIYFGGVFYSINAAGMGAPPVAGRPHSIHGQLVSLRVPRCVGCRRLGCVCDHDRGGDHPVRRGDRAVGSQLGHPRMRPRRDPDQDAARRGFGT